MMNIDRYNEDLRARDAAKTIRRSQPSGLAKYQAAKNAAEAEELAPYAIVKDGYEYCVTCEGRGSEVNRHRTRREALEEARALKAHYDKYHPKAEAENAAETIAEPAEPIQPDAEHDDVMDMIHSVLAAFA